jgi:hypothetical protein
VAAERGTLVRIAMTGFNRPQYMRETIESWAKVRGIQDVVTEFHLEPGHPGVAEVCEAAPFPHEIYVAEQHQGCQKNPWKAANSAFERDSFVVLAEDDIIVGKDTLEYFRWAEAEFADRDDVMFISAAQGKHPPGGSYVRFGGVTVEPRFSSWVWGTWRTLWRNLLAPDWKFAYEYQGWDYRLNLYWCQEVGYKTVIPQWSRAQHIGEHGGTHCQPSQFRDLQSPCFIPDLSPQQYFTVGQA